MGNVRMRAEQINYGASNVKVALDDLDPKDLIALSERMDAIEAWKATVKTEEKTGAEVTFTNALALAAVSLSAEIEAIQDLHGYDKPWVGGAGKNKVDDSTIEGGYYYDTDGTASPSTNTFCRLPMVKCEPDTTYTLYCSTNVYTVWFFSGIDNSDSISKINNVADTTVTFTTPNNCIYLRISLYGDYTNSRQVQLELGSIATSYEPYSNICPISGRTAVTITDYDSESNTATVTIQLGQTVYGGTLNVTTGVMTITHANIASYNGETIGEPWISSMDEYTEGGTPTTGAQVVYTLATPTTATLTAEQLEMVKGYNRISANSGDITVKAYTGAAWGGDEA